MVMNYLERIEELANSAPSFEQLISSMDANIVEYDVTGGFSVGHGIIHDGDCAIQKFWVTGQSIFPTHVHDEWEYLIILNGEGEYIINNERIPFKANDCIIVKPGDEHSWCFTKHTKMIAITIPASKGYPDGKR